MNSQERIAASLRHQPTDRIAIDFGGHRSSGIAAVAYAKLKKHLGITSGDIYVYDMVQQLAIIENEVLDIFGVDTIELGRGFSRENTDWKDWVLPDGTPCKIPAFLNLTEKNGDWFLFAADGVELGVQKKGCLYFEQSHFPFEGKEIKDVDLAKDLAWGVGHNVWGGIPTPGCDFPLDEAGLKKLSEGAAKLRQSTDRAIIALFGGNMFELPQWLFRMDNYLMQMGVDPDGTIALSERLCDLHMQRLELWLPAVKDDIDVVLFGDDLGSQRGPMMSPAMYRKYYQPYHSKLWKRAKEIAPNIRTNLHCCGGVEPLLNDLIDAGLDSINPVQITCSGMDPSQLMSKFGGRMTFWGGGCDTRTILPTGTPDEVREHVRNQIDLFAPRNSDGSYSGGFVFQQVHNIMANVPPENIVAMFDVFSTLRG